MSLPPAAERIMLRFRITGAIGIAICLMLLFLNPETSFRGYLVGYLLWIGLPIGATGLLMLYHLTNGNWGLVTRRMMEASMRTFKVMAVLFLPLLFGLRHPFQWWWADPKNSGSDPMLVHNHAYLNVPFFLVRTAVYFVIWIAIAMMFSNWSAQQDETADELPARKLNRYAAPTLIVLGFTATLAAVDWIMSLEPHWYSTIYGMWFLLGGALTTLAVLVISARRFAMVEPMNKVYLPAHFHDLGNLMLAFTMLWAYVSFSQFLIIWSGNLPEETPFYVKRMGEGWQTIAAVLVLFHFAVPFLILLSRDVKRKIERLATLAVGMLIIRVVDLYWVVEPSWGGSPALRPMDLLAPIAIGALWVSEFLREFSIRPLMPVHNPQDDPNF